MAGMYQRQDKYDAAEMFAAESLAAQWQHRAWIVRSKHLEPDDGRLAIPEHRRVSLRIEVEKRIAWWGETAAVKPLSVTRSDAVRI